IAELKEAGFTLNEIRLVLNGNGDAEALFRAKRSELEQTLNNLEKVKKKMSDLKFNESDFEPLTENIDLPFENDERAVGKWEIVSGDDVQVGGKKRELYFLPKGEWYWCYGWTKGKLLYDDGYSTFANDYILEEHSDGLYMVVRFKSYDYVKSGKVTPVVLKQLDNKCYIKNEIARKDNVDLPFRNDESVIGKWKAVDFILDKEEFSASVKSSKPLYFKEAEFFEGGSCSVVYGDEVISDKEQICWTKGFMLKKWNSTACAYEIRKADGKDYLIAEWKSGDYRWGGMDTDYYVFVRN
ncbi:MAG: MerR family DNA-binding protein, partial [Oscillospiraceae bacterium]|nr:MerR family DNA-binding protein [Oscillospiraceae bacterium]